MRKRKNYSLVFFIAHIPQLIAGERSVWLHLIVDRLRKDYGLYGAKLLHCVHDINSMKCFPPLEDGEVEDIVRLPNVGSVHQKRELREFEDRQKLAKDRLAAHAKHRKQK